MQPRISLKRVEGMNQFAIASGGTALGISLKRVEGYSSAGYKNEYAAVNLL